MKILVLHGPNLNMLGRREPDIYGRTTLAEIDALLHERAQAADIQLYCLQSNHEGALIDFLQAEGWDADGIIINPGALTHYGLALREAFRHTSVVAPVATGQIAGLGWRGYLLALEWLLTQP
jgi:3-dehydroquinate dehydratase II